jgi:murein DD-endopeptidase MepM/ murein hydrolase activator NlpD
MRAYSCILAAVVTTVGAVGASDGEGLRDDVAASDEQHDHFWRPLAKLSGTVAGLAQEFAESWWTRAMAETPTLTMLSAEPLLASESSGYGWRDDPLHGRRKFHSGTDFRAERGTKVFAAGPGTVVFAGRKRGYGRFIEVDHGSGILTRYAHLSAVNVRSGEFVRAADLIGRVGATGRATGPHLHFEVRIGKLPVDPVLAMNLAALQRISPGTAQLAALALSPEAQGRSLDRHDPRNQRGANAGGRRATRKRSRSLW